MKIIIGIIAIVVLIGLLQVGELYSQLARYKTYWNRQNQQTLASSTTENIRYYALGDSAAQGIGATSPTKSYPSLVANDLAANSDNRIDLINLSKSGAKIRDAIDAQVPVMQSQGVQKNTIVTIDIGANDILSFDPVIFEKEMDELMAMLPKQTVISDMPSFAGTRFSSHEKSVLEANEIIVRLSDKHDLRRAALFDRVSANHGVSTLAIDFFHPSNKGYRENWAPAFLEALSMPQPR